MLINFNGGEYIDANLVCGVRDCCGKVICSDGTVYDKYITVYLISGTCVPIYGCDIADVVKAINDQKDIERKTSLTPIVSELFHIYERMAQDGVIIKNL